MSELKPPLMNANHTPLPWSVGLATIDGKSHLSIAERGKTIPGKKFRLVCCLSEQPNQDPEDEANALFILDAVHSHELMKSYLQILKHRFDADNYSDNAAVKVVQVEVAQILNAIEVGWDPKNPKTDISEKLHQVKEVLGAI